MSKPLADIIRPTCLQDVVGQEHLLSENGVLYKIINSGHIPNMIFYGPSGVGKTTVARIISKKSGKKLHKLNGTNASTSDIKAVIDELGTIEGMNGILLYLDEIQYLNKKQQQTLLEFIETGDITLIASTTENPYFYVYNAILSRSTVFEFKPINKHGIKSAINRSVTVLSHNMGNNIIFDGNALDMIADGCGGDVRKAINLTEVCAYSSNMIDNNKHITEDIVTSVTGKSSSLYDKNGDQHYNLLSALQKSIRGSDENASLHYLARILDAGDLKSPIRRLLVIASEDIGLAYPNAVSIVKACTDTALQLGLPEAKLPLAQAVILLCTSPKSNSVIKAIDSAMADVTSGNFSEVPDHLKDGHYAGANKMGHSINYKYPHDYKYNYVEQQYLPDEIKNRIYYEFGENKIEQAALKYRNIIKNYK